MAVFYLHFNDTHTENTFPKFFLSRAVLRRLTVSFLINYANPKCKCAALSERETHRRAKNGCFRLRQAYSKKDSVAKQNTKKK